MNIFNLVMILAVTTTFGVSVRFGGRYERYAGMLCLLGWVAGILVQRLFLSYAPLPAMIGLDMTLLAAYLWLACRHRPTWVWVMTLLQAGVVAAETLHFALPDAISWWALLQVVNILIYLQYAVLLCAVARRRIGPPFLPPRRA